MDTEQAPIPTHGEESTISNLEAAEPIKFEDFSKIDFSRIMEERKWKISLKEANHVKIIILLNDLQQKFPNLRVAGTGIDNYHYVVVRSNEGKTPVMVESVPPAIVEPTSKRESLIKIIKKALAPILAKIRPSGRKDKI